ncbi:transcriptional regulator, TetR family [Andreprevotia lacus DSM 23236]|uniref:Transcriptional regulator, TetR family n=1 Tax=Andreprevotia lacus DSM 23236 TaxID=1121001 RepID=A0A1W1XKR0_9NEIS|nr:TetR/AcrR family transcriptional regulator [Andreprevotia lacus]SMC24397.1 transcriptional regulator, TetR family [Andreprevotia lacus DSM 23236]
MSSATTPYHHGDLKNALIEAAVTLIEEEGVDAVSVRAVAKRVGVSPGAPFRHFESRTALLTAVAEVAMARLAQAIDQALAQAGGQSALTQYMALGRAFLDWAFANPTHFRVISSRALIDFDGSGLAAANHRIRDRMRALLQQALDDGEIRNVTVDDAMLATRALAYGLARMYVDGQMQSWDVEPAQGLQMAHRLLDEQVMRLA